MVSAKVKENVGDGAGNGKRKITGGDEVGWKRTKHSGIKLSNDKAYGVHEDDGSKNDTILNLEEHFSEVGERDSVVVQSKKLEKATGANDSSCQNNETPEQSSSWGAAAATSKTETVQKNTNDTQDEMEDPLFLGELSDDVLVNILPHLPVEAKLRFRCASKEWKAALKPYIKRKAVDRKENGRELIKKMMQEMIPGQNLAEYVGKTSLERRTEADRFLRSVMVKNLRFWTRERLYDHLYSKFYQASESTRF